MENCKRLYADTLAFYRRELSGPVFTAGWAFAGIVVLGFAFSLLSPPGPMPSSPIMPKCSGSPAWRMKAAIFSFLPC